MGRRCKSYAPGLLLLGVMAASVEATPLNLTLLDSPDIFADFIDVEYNAGTDVFSAAGFALTLDDDGAGPAVNIAGGTFALAASIDETGALIVPAGSLIITGTVLGMGPNLLTATVTDFGFADAGGDIFEFLLTVTGGDLAIPSLFGSAGAAMGVILDANGSGFTGDFDVSFANFTSPGGGLGVADSAAVPEPASVTLMALMGFGALLRRRRA